jgi:hypothetical protein
MCVIIDASVRDRVFTNTQTPEAVVLQRWILHGGGSIVFGGTLYCHEILKSDRAKRDIRTWWRAGLAHQYPNGAVDREAGVLKAQSACISNDSHIIALARVSGARTLYSSDQELHRDFKNPALIDNPRGGIYQSVDHEALLTHSVSCSAGRKRLADGLWGNG